MAFFDDSFMKKQDNEEDDLLKQVEEVQQENTNNQGNELDVNRKNREAYENLMQESTTSYDMYYDKNNVFLKLFMFLLLVFIICGVAYYVLQYLAN